MRIDAESENNYEKESIRTIVPPSKESNEESEDEEDDVQENVVQNTGGLKNDEPVYDQTNDEEDESVEEK